MTLIAPGISRGHGWRSVQGEYEEFVTDISDTGESVTVGEELCEAIGLICCPCRSTLYCCTRPVFKNDQRFHNNEGSNRSELWSL